MQNWQTIAAEVKWTVWGFEIRYNLFFTLTGEI